MHLKGDSMQRVVYVPDKLSTKKYVLREEYEGFGIYERITPSGYYESQSWLVFNGKYGYISESYNSRCKEELLDSIDHYNTTKKFGLHGFIAKKEEDVTIFGEHPCNRNFNF